MGNTLFGMMNTSASGLRTAQIAVNVTGNNIANANNPAFSRQRAVFGSAMPIHVNGVGFLGGGVTVKDIQRIRDNHLDIQIRNETSNLKDLEAQRDALIQLENIFNEPSDHGLNQLMTDMWNAWEQLNNNPENLAFQTLVQENTRAVADQLNLFTNQLNGVVADLDARQDAEIEAAANLIEQINELNTMIEKAQRLDAGNAPNDLLDQRDALLGELAEFMPIEVTYNSNHTVAVSGITSNGPVDVLTLDGAGIKEITPDLTSGSLRGYEEARAEVQDYQQRLDQYALGLATAMNEMQVANGGEPIFIFDENQAAGSISLNPELEDIVAVSEILSLRDTPIMIDGQEIRLDQFYQSMMTDLGVKADRTQTLLTAQVTLLSHLEDRRESISGVSIDEEMMNLIQFQAAYDANAQVMATITEMIDTIIHRLGA